MYTLIRTALALLLLAGLQACTSIPVEQRPDKRAELNRIGDETIAMMVEKTPGIADELEASAGYFVSKISAANGSGCWSIRAAGNGPSSM